MKNSVLKWEFGPTQVIIHPTILAHYASAYQEDNSRIQRIYALSSPQDAKFCGSSFSEEEVQAARQGPKVYLETFGLGPEYALTEYASAEVETAGISEPSVFAGKPGHRWAWLIRDEGWDSFSAIVRMEDVEARDCEIEISRELALSRS